MYVILIFALGYRQKDAAFFASPSEVLVLFPRMELAPQRLAVAPPFAGAWSLGIEEKFYLVWPIVGFVFCATRFRIRVYFLSAVAAASGIALFTGRWATILQPYGLIAMGCVLTVLLNSSKAYDRLATLGRPHVMLGTTVVLF